MSDLHLTEFLRDVANLIESSNLSPNKLQKVGEFYMSYKMLGLGEGEGEELDELGEEKVEKVDNPLEFSSEEITKFITMGWYVYSLLKNKNS
jgi:hypothetical protein